MEYSSLSYKDSKAAADLHQQAFKPGWTEEDFLKFLNDPLVHGLKGRENTCFIGYVLWREILDEAEILTLVVPPSHRRKGIGATLLREVYTILRGKDIKRLFLEVAEDNLEGISFYTQQNFTFLGKRPYYYPREGKGLIPALNFMKDLV